MKKSQLDTRVISSVRVASSTAVVSMVAIVRGPISIVISTHMSLYERRGLHQLAQILKRGIWP